MGGQGTSPTFFEAGRSFWARLEIIVRVLWTLKFEDSQAKRLPEYEKLGCVQGPK